MNVDIMIEFAYMCKELGINPTWEGLKKFNKLVEELKNN